MSENLLSDDHADVDALLGAVFQKIEAGDASEVLRSLDLFWARLAMHIRAEHLHLFPAAVKISERDLETDVLATLDHLRRDHDFFMHELADLMKAIRSMTSGSEFQIMRETAVRLRTIKDRLERHNALEEAQIYPLQRLLVASEREHLTRSIEKEITNLPGRFSKD